MIAGMSENKNLNPAPPLEAPPVFVNLGDGVERELRYSIASMKRIKQKLRRPMLGSKGQLLEIDEELIPELIWEGLRGEDGSAPDVSVETIERLPSRFFGHLLNAFLMAFTGASPEKNAPAPPTTPVS